ncbi:MAG: (2,3-dihydroxybenzoyl)adenylate synthase [Deltaproteobacteria bacterium]|nr:MAG: (2,3-dihydroxybenzoyl)adenylate synthase [Deltaproteobacteria bacterium]
MLEGCVPWPPEFARLYVSKGYWEEKTLVEKLEEVAKEVPNKEALVYKDQRITYSQMIANINRLALHFLKIGLKPRDRVVLQLPNCPQFVYTFFALIKIGVIPVMALPAHRHTEITYFLRHSDAVGYIIPSEWRRFNYVKMAEEIARESVNLNFIFVTGSGVPGNMISIDELLSRPADQEGHELQDYLLKIRPDPYDVALLHLSGGTTALPKLIPRTHNDYVYNAKQSGAVAGLDESTVLLAVLPMAHNYTLASCGIIGTWFHKGKVVISPDLDTDTVFSLVEQEKVTVIPAAVPLIVRWLNSKEIKHYDFTSLKVIQNGGMKLAPELRKAVQEEFRCMPQEVYGNAEGLLNFVRPDDPEEMILHSSGRPISEADEIKVCDDEGKPLPVGEIGELYARGPYTIRGYYRAPDHNKNAFTEDGFYKTGDLVRLNHQGYIFYEGRKKDVINRGGEKINAEEIENLILSFPKVKNVAVVAMPDPVYGEKACAYIIPKEGETVNFKELIDFLISKNVAKFKLPERIEIVSEFPLSPAGKVLKRVLREDIAKKLELERQK